MISLSDAELDVVCRMARDLPLEKRDTICSASRRSCSSAPAGTSIGDLIAAAEDHCVACRCDTRRREFELRVDRFRIFGFRVFSPHHPSGRPPANAPVTFLLGRISAALRNSGFRQFPGDH